MYRIVQITDCHLFADTARELRGAATWPRLEAVLEELRMQLADADLFILIGDTAHDEQLETYQALRRQLAPWAERVRAIPGNHDHRQRLRDVFSLDAAGPPGRMGFQVCWSEWQVFGLDSQCPGELPGSLGTAQLDWLRGVFSQHQIPALVFLHHPPVSVHSPWLDKIGLQDAAALAEVLRACPHVRLLGGGHVHQEAAATLGQAVVFATPAVGPQFRPRAEQLEIEAAPPGFRLFELPAGGQWSTQALRAAGGRQASSLDAQSSRG